MFAIELLVRLEFLFLLFELLEPALDVRDHFLDLLALVVCLRDDFE